MTDAAAPNDEPRSASNLDGEATRPAATSADSAGSIGPYRLLLMIGEGGMGEVWLAEQADPVRRRVALKLIKAGMDSRQVIARFAAERQALALMDHPSIAKVFDAGTTSEGRPYFVMEHIHGVPITEHCDRQRLTNRERLELFVQVCEGVQHAHQKAVIHRDLKPSNVLVTVQDGRAVPKIIDFGVAKATGQRLTEKTLFTELGALIGTPEYMSPEQAEMTGQDVDTRTDVYSLGVMLYELLVGALPFDPKELRSAGFAGIVRKIREEEPPKPSTRLSTLGERSTDSAERRRADVRTLRNELRGDLDWIAMKALEKDRTRRYGSPAELAADIARYLGDEPVQARPPSAVYRSRKFCRRHRLGVTAGLVVCLALVTGISGTTIGLVRARRAEAAARMEQERAGRVAGFLTDMLGGANPVSMGATLRSSLLSEAAKRSETHSPEDAAGAARRLESSLESMNVVDVARELVDLEILSRAVKRVESELEGEPALAAEIYHAIGSAYAGLQLYQPAGQSLVRAAEMSERAHGAEHLMTIKIKLLLAGVYKRSGRYRDAGTIFRDVLDVMGRTRREETEEALWAMDHLGDTLRYQGRYTEAGPLLRNAQEATLRIMGPESHVTLDVSNNLAMLLLDQGRFDEAERLLRDTAEKMSRVLGPEHDQTINTLTNRARALRRSGRLVEAEALLQEILDRSRRALGEEVYNTLAIRVGLAEVYADGKRFEEAESLLRDCLPKLRRALGEEHPETLGQLNNLARLLAAQGRFTEAVPLFAEVLAGFRAVLGDAHTRTLRVANGLAATYRQLGRVVEAEELFLATASALTKDREAAADRVYADAAFHLACLSASGGDRSKAMEWLKNSVDAGFAFPERTTEDPSLKSLRGPELDALVERSRR